LELLGPVCGRLLGQGQHLQVIAGIKGEGNPELALRVAVRNARAPVPFFSACAASSRHASGVKWHCK